MRSGLQRNAVRCRSARTRSISTSPLRDACRITPSVPVTMRPRSRATFTPARSSILAIDTHKAFRPQRQRELKALANKLGHRTLTQAAIWAYLWRACVNPEKTAPDPDAVRICSRSKRSIMRASRAYPVCCGKMIIVRPIRHPRSIFVSSEILMLTTISNSNTLPFLL